MTVARSSDVPGIDIIDPIERRCSSLFTPETVTPETIDTGGFQFPVDSASKFETSQLTLPFNGHLWVRDGAGNVLAKADPGFEGSFPDGTYCLEPTGLIKIYLRIEAGFRIDHSNDRIRITFPKVTTVNIGTRSMHERPARTIQTSTDPTDLLAAISCFGASLKTTSPERAFPTLRGHPPELEVTTEPSIPEEMGPPVEDVWLEVPPSLEDIFPIVPLAYYLGVRVQPGSVPLLRSDDFSLRLTRGNQYEQTVHELLQKIFFLDCLTRTEGLYPVELAEREVFTDRTEFSFATAYQATFADRLASYLEIPYETVEDLIPEWQLAASVDPTSGSIEMLPFLTAELALIETGEAARVTKAPSASIEPEGFARGAEVQGDRAQWETESLVKSPPQPGAIDRTWVGEGTPVDATKAIPSAFRNRFGRQSEDRGLEIAVVCNDQAMVKEGTVSEIYGDREVWAFTVELFNSLSRRELKSVIERSFDFIHYIGHIDPDGFRCKDGTLAIEELETIGPEAFFLNGCQSYTQGHRLIEEGAIGGIVTLNDIVNTEAIAIGQTLARLLNAGFQLRGALDITARTTVLANQYLVVGDGTLSIVQPSGGTPLMLKIDETNPNGEILGSVQGYGSPAGVGCLCSIYMGDESIDQLAGGRTDRRRISEDTIRRFLEDESSPVLIDGELAWTWADVAEYLPR